MVDAVYFLTEDKFQQHAELRHSLRSLARHVAGVGRVYVAGAAPQWPARDLVLIPETDPYDHNKDANIIRKMLITCGRPEISEPFLFVNDDHYFCRDCQAGEFPYYHKGEIPARPSSREYPRRLANTRRQLAMRGLPTLNYDVHTPILIHRERFLAAFEGWDYVDLPGPGVVMKSVYANSCPEITGTYLRDCKFTVKTGGNAAFWAEKLTLERPCWSSGNHLSRLVWEVWAALYPQPSRYEG